MRGSPLLRTLLLVGALLLAGWGMLRFVDASAQRMPERAPVQRAAEVQRYGFALKLSAPLRSVELKARGGKVLFHGGPADPLEGTIALDPADPVVFLNVAWKDAPSPEARFVKLTLEPPGKPTLNHYFEAPGDFEDVWELPIE